MDLETEDNEKEDIVNSPNYIKKYLIMIILFIIIVSNVFQENFLAMFGNTIKEGKITLWGTIIQATLFTVTYILLMHLVEIGAI